jgi:N-acetyl-anhydromuramyl-L-alanine amidase AmpD
MSLFTEYIKAVYEDTTWPNDFKPGILAWAIAEQGENRNAVCGMGELARFADNYHSLHFRQELANLYPFKYHLLSTTEEDNNYFNFSSAQQELEALYKFVHRPVYGDVDSHMGSFEEMLNFITPTFCPREGYVDYVLSFIPEAEKELKRLGWEDGVNYRNGTERWRKKSGYTTNNGLLYLGGDTVPYYETPNKDKWIKNVPSSIILHYTAAEGGSGIADWFMNPSAGVSAHLLIEKSGRVMQFVPFHIPAWHSGTTKYNRSSIGIEIENLGCSRIKVAGKVIFNIWGGPKMVDEDNCIYAAHFLEPKTFRWWPKYTDAQYRVLNEIIPVLRQKYGRLVLLGHEQVLPGKLDPGMALDWNRVRRDPVV